MKATQFWKNKTVLVAGGLGFVGAHVIEELLRQDAKVICLYRGGDTKFFHKRGLDVSNLTFQKIDLLDSHGVNLVTQNADVLINCAALDGNAEFKRKNAAKILDSNLRIVSNLLNAAVENSISDVVLLSSAEVYPGQVSNPIRESDDYRKNWDYTDNGYVLSKRFSEIMGEAFRSQYGIKIYHPRPANIYGPRDHFGSAMNRVIPSMIKKIADDQDVEIWGDGSQVRSFVYVTDAAKGILGMVENEFDDYLNIGSPEAISVLELANRIGDLQGKKVKANLDTSKPGGSARRVLDVANHLRMTGGEYTDLNSGIDQTIQWYLA
ncbi:MAG TPA: NAD(P)-dependent oxidoreductase [Candidatus Saccharimonadia bacterium]|nr:NAD(P)-dependent oxidoreductase [Candidatus Saccharimonadia bacterium]